MLSDQPILLIITYRDEELTRHHNLFQLLPHLVREAHAQRLHLQSLADEAMHEWVTKRYRMADTDRARLTDYLSEKADGNPFFIEEMLTLLEDREVVRPGSTGWRLGNLDGLPVPTLLRQVIEGRLTRLADEQRDLLQVAAVIGQEVSLELWTAVSNADSTDIAALLEQATEANLLTESLVSPMAYFRHAVIREVLYESLVLVRRMELHRQVAETLIAQPGPDPDAVGYHFERAHDPCATTWLIRAGVRAEERYAILTAIDRYQRAQVLLEVDPDAAQTRGWLLLQISHLLRMIDPRQSFSLVEEAQRLAHTADDPLLIAYSCQLHGIVQLTLNLNEVKTGLTEAAEGVRLLDQVSPAAEKRARQAIASIFPRDAFTDPRGTSGNLLYKLTLLPNVNILTPLHVLWLATAGRFHEAMEIGESFVQQVSESTDDERLIQDVCGIAYRGLANAAQCLGQPEVEHHWRSLALEAFRVIGHHAQVMQIYGEVQRCLLTWHIEQVAERRRVNQAHLAAAQLSTPALHLGIVRIPGTMLDFHEGRWNQLTGVHHPFGAVWGTPIRGFLNWHCGKPELAWESVNAVLDGPSAQPGTRVYGGAVAAHRLAINLSLDAGDLADARSWLEGLDRWQHWSGDVTGQATRHMMWAAYHERSGNLDRAREDAEHALVLASDPRKPIDLICVFRILGELDLIANDFENAERRLRESVELAEICALPVERAVTLLALADLRVRTNQFDEASNVIAEVRSICEPIRAVRILARVDELDQQLCTAKRQRCSPAGLTPRELEILRLVSQGLTDAQIAGELYISPSTVMNHVSSILSKLQVNTRTAAAAIAVREDLV